MKYDVQPGSPRVSVSIPLYRSARFINTIIANIEAMPMDDIEILISDRHCYDDTIDLLMERYAHDGRVRCFKYHDKLDWVGNINALLEEARGEYWRFLPHDDISPPGSLEALILALDTHKEAILAYGPTQAIDLEGNRISQRDHLYPKPDYVETKWTLGIALEMGWNFRHFVGSFKGLVRRKIVVENNLFIRSTLGQVFPERCWQFALCLLGRFHFVPEALYIKRYYSNSTHAQWNISGRNFFSIAWVMTTYLWDLVKPLPIRLYGIWDLWLNARLIARWVNNGRRGKRPYRRAPDFLCWLFNRGFLSYLPAIRSFCELRQKQIYVLRETSLPQIRN